MPVRDGMPVFALCAALAVLAPQPGICQAKGTTGTTAPTGSTTGTTTGTTNGTLGTSGTASSSTTSNTNTSNNSVQTPVFISGRVLMEDGTPPSEPVAIER